MNKFMQLRRTGLVITFESFDKRIQIEYKFPGFEVFYQVPNPHRRISIYRSRLSFYRPSKTSIEKMFVYGYNVNKQMFTLQINDKILITGKAVKQKDDEHNTIVIELNKVVRGGSVETTEFTCYDSPKFAWTIVETSDVLTIMVNEDIIRCAEKG